VVIGLIVFFVTRDGDGGDEQRPPVAGAGAADAGSPPRAAPVDAGAGVLPTAPVDAAVVVVPVGADAAVPVRPPADAAVTPAKDEYTVAFDAARAALRRNRLDEALDRVDEAIKLKRTGRAVELKADILLEKGDTGAALSFIDDALNRAPTASMWKKKGWAHYKMHDYDAAKEAFKKYLDARPKASDAEMIRNLIGETP
jgi:tetratricopeptide (TPR) repeat protein